MEIGERIAYYRKRKDMSQARLAELLEVSFQAVSSWERGVYAPDVERLASIAAALDIPVGRLLEDETPREWVLRDRLFDEARMYTFVKAAAVAKGLTETSAALPYMKAHHAGQTRKGRAHIPYVIHPLTMACHALAMGLDDDALLAALLLHDVVEDCGVPLDALPVSDAVRRTVDLVTFDKTDSPRHEAKARYFRRVATDPAASLVKCIDRVNNLSGMAAGFSRERMAEYIAETEEFGVPLLRIVKDASPKWSNAAWLLTYQTLALLETCKRLL